MSLSNVKDVKKQPGCKNFYMSIYHLIQKGKYPSQIARELGITRQGVSYYLSSLKKDGLVEKIGYGVWQTCKNINPEDVKISTRVAIDTPHSKDSLKQDSVRGHAFQFKLDLPDNLGSNWKKREEIFHKIGIKFKKLNIFGGGQVLNFRGRKVWLTNKSIIIYEKESFISEKAKECKSQAINHFLKLIKGLERDLRANFSNHGRYRFRVTRQHYSLIKNALAKQYNDEGKKLEIYNDKGLWFLIDNSFNLNEAETIHPKTAVSDNEKVQDFFNGLKTFDGYTPQFVVNSIGQLSNNWNQYGVHIKSHIKAIQELGEGVKKNNEIMEKMLAILNQKS